MNLEENAPKAAALQVGPVQRRQDADVTVLGPPAMESLPLLGELAGAGVKLIKASSALLDQVMRISANQSQVAKLLAACAQSWAAESKHPGKLPPAHSTEAGCDTLFQMASTAAETATASAAAMRVIVGALTMPIDGQNECPGDLCATLLDIHCHMQKLVECTAWCTLDPDLSSKQASQFRLAITNMAAATRQHTYLAICAAEAVDHFHAEALSFIRALSTSMGPPG